MHAGKASSAAITRKRLYDCVAPWWWSIRWQGAAPKNLWDLLHSEPFVNSLGALTGNQAMQQVKAGLKAIYLSGWQVAGDANGAGEMYPDQSLYPANSVPYGTRNWARYRRQEFRCHRQR